MRILLPKADSQRKAWIALVLLITPMDKRKIVMNIALVPQRMMAKKKALKMVLIQMTKTRLMLHTKNSRDVFLMSREKDLLQNRKCKTV